MDNEGSIVIDGKKLTEGSCEGKDVEGTIEGMRDSVGSWLKVGICEGFSDDAGMDTLGKALMDGPVEGESDLSAGLDGRILTVGSKLGDGYGVGSNDHEGSWLGIREKSIDGAVSDICPSTLQSK